MNCKAWKMSASVIVAFRPPAVRDTLLTKSSQEGTLKPERSSLHILSLRRGQTDKHLPGIHVFPGGHLDESDKNPAWIDFYKSMGYEENSFLSLSTGGVDHLPEYKDSSCIPGWMSLRLCAIRETFEESGILMCRTPSGVQQKAPFSSFVILNEIAAWQNRVKSDPRQMLALCSEAGCVPDLWGLHLWSNWLAPTQQRVRHNSVFFLAVLQAQPPHSIDHSEMDELKWCSALELLENAAAGSIRLANPQFYEALRLSNFRDADALASYACDRSQLGCDRIMPVQERARDGMLFLLPGDSAYPQKIDCITSCEPVQREESLQNLREHILAEDGVLHRTEIHRGSLCQRVFVHNYVPPYDHIVPSTMSCSVEEPKSHL